MLKHIPWLSIPLPRPVRLIHQIEITSLCNLKCKWCVHQTMTRPKIHMTEMVFARTLELIRQQPGFPTRVELNLAGTGESTLHPAFPDFVRRAREAVGDRVRLIFATNGVGVTEGLVRALAPSHPAVWVSLHQPEKAARAIRLYRKHGLLEGISVDPSVNSNDWAGQVDWPVSAVDAVPCQWLREGKTMVMADGRITTCCLDSTGEAVLGHVDTIDPNTLMTQPYRLCQSCYQEICIHGFNQKGCP